MTFTEIFLQDGLYVAPTFRAGMAFQIKQGVLSAVTYATPSSITPKVFNPILSKELIEANFERKYTRQSLFTK